jgi:hypothetical protein
MENEYLSSEQLEYLLSDEYQQMMSEFIQNES